MKLKQADLDSFLFVLPNREAYWIADPGRLFSYSEISSSSRRMLGRQHSFLPLAIPFSVGFYSDHYFLRSQQLRGVLGAFHIKL